MFSSFIGGVVFWIWRITGWMPKYRSPIDRAFDRLEATDPNDEVAYNRALHQIVVQCAKTPEQLAEWEAASASAPRLTAQAVHPAVKQIENEIASGTEVGKQYLDAAMDALEKEGKPNPSVSEVRARVALLAQQQAKPEEKTKAGNSD
jgi:hypothetical protein